MGKRKASPPEATLRDGLVDKLRPGRCKVSSKFHAILGCMLGEEWTTPKLTALCVTSDGHVLGEKEGEWGFNLYLSDVSDLERNIRGVCRAVDATANETGYLLNRINTYKV